MWDSTAFGGWDFSCDGLTVQCDIYYGSSGSGILTYYPDGPKVVGVHSFAYTGWDWNGGPAFTSGVASWISSW